MRDDQICTRWSEFTHECPEIADTIYEQALHVCEIGGDPETSIESEAFRSLRDMVVEHQKELGLPIDMSESELLRWATCGVFNKVILKEGRR